MDHESICIKLNAGGPVKVTVAGWLNRRKFPVKKTPPAALMPILPPILLSLVKVKPDSETLGVSTVMAAPVKVIVVANASCGANITMPTAAENNTKFFIDILRID